MFAGCLFFYIGSSSADFRDLGLGRKVSHRAPDGRPWETVRPPFDFLGKWQHFRTIPRRCPGDDRPEAHRWPSGLRSIAGGRQWILRSSVDHRQVTFWSPCGHRRVMYGFSLEICFQFSQENIIEHWKLVIDFTNFNVPKLTFEKKLPQALLSMHIFVGAFVHIFVGPFAYYMTWTFSVFIEATIFHNNITSIYLYEKTTGQESYC